MAMVTVTGNVVDHARVPLAGRSAELWFRPNRSNVAGGALLTDKWVRATVVDASGAFTVQLDNSPGIYYTPILRYLLDPSDPAGWGFDEWRDVQVFPALGGSISDLATVGDLSMYSVYVAIAAPPAGYRGWWLHAAPGDPDNPAVSGTGELRMVTG